MVEEFFNLDERLGIPIPCLEKNWKDYNEDAQDDILFQWEHIRGQIPDRIALLEKEINRKQAKLAEETDFMRCCRLNNDIAELASVINDLWIWYRTNDKFNKSKIEH